MFPSGSFPNGSQLTMSNFQKQFYYKMLYIARKFEKLDKASVLLSKTYHGEKEEDKIKSRNTEHR